MQEAHSTSKSDGLPFADALVELPLLVPLPCPAAVVCVLVGAMSATDGDFDPPQPATSTARLTSPAASAAARRATRRRFTP
jgi:hypothetical protein